MRWRKTQEMFFFPSGREGSVTSGHVQQPGWERDKALGEEKPWAGRHSIAQRMRDRWQIWQWGGHRATCKLFLLQEHTTQHCTGAASPAWQVCWGVASFQACCIQKAASEMLHAQFSLGERLSRIRGKIRGKAERLSLASLHKPTFPTQRTTQPGWCSGKGWQPLS